MEDKGQFIHDMFHCFSNKIEFHILLTSRNITLTKYWEKIEIKNFKECNIELTYIDKIGDIIGCKCKIHELEYEDPEIFEIIFGKYIKMGDTFVKKLRNPKDITPKTIKPKYINLIFYRGRHIII